MDTNWYLWTPVDYWFLTLFLSDMCRIIPIGGKTSLGSQFQSTCSMQGIFPVLLKTFLCRLLVINITSESKKNSEVQNKLVSLKGWKLLPVLRTSADLSLLITNIAWYSCVPVSCQNVERMRFYLWKGYSNNSKKKAHFVIFKWGSI